jgi:hypothetical protein
MSYNRQPNTVVAGIGLNQTPPVNTVSPAGIVPVVLDANIATTTSLGIIQVGSGLAITASGILSATGGGSSGSPILNVYKTSTNYTATASDCYIGASNKNITITFPLGVLGKVYIVKNMANGNITVKGTGQNLDSSGDKVLGSMGMLIAVFDGTVWSLV